MSYFRFIAMYILMYLNTYSYAHVYWSQTRAWMALYMGAVMALIMLGYMLAMYRNRAANSAIVVVGVVVFSGSLYLLRSQNTVDDVAWMRAMIPHHSIAILTSERANITDPRVRALADAIIATQLREIAEMETLIEDLDAP